MWLICENIRMAAEAQGYTVAALLRVPERNPAAACRIARAIASKIARGTLTGLCRMVAEKLECD
jgi:hypothetical protein